MSDFALYLRSLPPNEALIAAGLCLLAAAGGGYFWWVGLKRSRLMADTPTSKLRSAAQGFVELHGDAHWLKGDRIHSPLSGQSCVWWDYKIEEKRQRYSNKGTRTQWVRVAGARSTEIFLLDDGTGEAVIDPCGAKIYGAQSRTWHGNTPRPQGPPRQGFRFGLGRYRYSESWLPVGSDLYALGWLRTDTARADPMQHREEMRLWLTELKADQQRLLREFDHNQDGEIDQSEWEQAREVARAEIDAKLLERSLAPGVSVLGRPPSGQDYVLSTHSEEQLLKRLRWKSRLGFIGLAAGASTMLYMAMARGWI
nr:hypothetical protein [Oceanococcus sp. HetDA_MAG_MS8]